MATGRQSESERLEVLERRLKMQQVFGMGEVDRPSPNLAETFPLDTQELKPPPAPVEEPKKYKYRTEWK